MNNMFEDDEDRLYKDKDGELKKGYYSTEWSVYDFGKDDIEFIKTYRECGCSNSKHFYLEDVINHFEYRISRIEEMLGIKLTENDFQKRFETIHKGEMEEND